MKRLSKNRNATAWMKRAMLALCVLMSLFGGAGSAMAAPCSTEAELRAAAARGDSVITITRDILLNQTLTIPAGVSVTINGDGRLSGSSDVDDLIAVESGAAVTFAGAVELNGQNISGSIVSIRGSVSVTEDTVVIGAAVISKPNGSGIPAQEAAGTGAIEVLSGGSLALRGGRITGNTVRSDYCGTVYVGRGGSISIQSGAKIYGNAAHTASGSYTLARASSGVFLHGGAAGAMTGGEIYGNTAMRGAAIMLYSVDENLKANFTLSGGEIYHNNGRTNSDQLPSSGAVHIEGNASLIMQEGVSDSGAATVPVIRDNSVIGIVTNLSKVSAVGGGVCVRDPGLSAEGGASLTKEFRTEFIMNGGRILDNSAYTGGGIYSFSNGTVLNAGVISGNTAIRQGSNGEYDLYGFGGMGGGVYCEGNTFGYSTLQIRDAVITDNTASFQGGGLWFCPTGNAQIYARHGAAIHGNTALGLNRSKPWGAGDDLFFGAAVESYYNGDPNAVPKHKLPLAGNPYPSLTLSDQALGGIDVQWYMDGFSYSYSSTSYYNTALWKPNLSILGTKTSRYQAGLSPMVSGIENGWWFYDASLDSKNFYAYALKCIAQEESLKRADSSAKLYITGNRSTFGGGVGSNGGVIIGEPGDPDMDVTLEKKWIDEENRYAIRPEAIEAELFLNGRHYQTVALRAADGWKAELKNLPLGEYTVKENALQSYQVGYKAQDLSTKSEEKIILTMTNTLDTDVLKQAEDLPKTGDSGRLGLWCMLGLISIIGAAAYRARARRE